jgi:hypothetical protein
VDLVTVKTPLLVVILSAALFGASLPACAEDWKLAWVVNLFQRNWPLTTFEAIRRQADKPDIVMPAPFKDVLEATLGF